MRRANELDTRSTSGRSKSESSDVGDASSTGRKKTSETSEPGSSHQYSPEANKEASPSNIIDDDEDLWSIWGELVKNWQAEVKKRPLYIKQLCRRGIPTHFRTIAWQLLSGADAVSVHEKYQCHLRQNSPHEKIIKRDIYRTYPELDFFKDGGKGQLSLLNVIKAYSLHDREVGYCQGTAFVVGQLLLQMPEEETFAVFLRLMEEYRMREIYKPTMTELGLCMFQLECIVQEQMPDLFMHFNNMGFDTSMYASSWFLTLFTTNLPLDLANRIMDAFLSEGMEVIFRCALAILQLCRVDLLQLDMEGMLKYFQRDMPDKFAEDHDLLFSSAYMLTINPKKMRKLEKDYLAKRSKEQEEAIELRRLRTECRLLRQRVDYLEKESEELADRLIRGQVNLAQTHEQTLNVTHEFRKLRDMNAAANKKLEEAYETIRELSCKVNQGMKEACTQVDDCSMVEHIHTLQQQLIETSAREADCEICIRDLKTRLTEMELSNKRLREMPPDHCVATLQEELVSVKMREAEANLSLKEMRQRLADLEQQWAKFVKDRCESTTKKPSTSSEAEAGADNSESDTCDQQPPPSATMNKRFSLLDMMPPIRRMAATQNNENSGAVKELEDQMMGIRIREADTLAELKEMRQKVMELETQNHVCSNQIKRQNEEQKKLKEAYETAIEQQKEDTQALKEEKRKTLEAQALYKEAEVQSRLREAELNDRISHLMQKIARMDQGHNNGYVPTGSHSLMTPEVEPMARSMTSSICSEGGDFQEMINRMKVRVPSIDSRDSDTLMLESDLVDQTIIENGHVLGIDSPIGMKESSTEKDLANHLVNGQMSTPKKSLLVSGSDTETGETGPHANF